MTADNNALRYREGDQPPPVSSPDSRSVQDELIRLIEQRRELGRKRYGTELRTFNGRDALQDAIEEGLDLVSYLTQLQAERDQMVERGGSAALVDILSRTGMDVSRGNIIRVSQMVERIQAWAHAQIVARTKYLSKQTAEANQQAISLKWKLEEAERKLAERDAQLVSLQVAHQDRVAMLLAAWEPCTPAWLADQQDHGNRNACALTARAWVPGGSNHYHPRGVHHLLPRENADERKVHHSDAAVFAAGAAEYQEEQGDGDRATADEATG